MTRFVMYATPLFTLALLLGATTLTLANNNQPTNADISLDGVSLGDHVMGPEIEINDLDDKIVVFEYWGDRCPPCHDSIPGLVKLRSEYGSDKLEIIANQVWTKDADKTKAAWEQHGGDDTITVVNHGKLKKTNHRGVPHAYVFDHNGKLIWNGNPHPRVGGDEMKKIVKEAIKALPDQG